MIAEKRFNAHHLYLRPDAWIFCCGGVMHSAPGGERAVPVLLQQLQALRRGYVYVKYFFPRRRQRECVEELQRTEHPGELHAASKQRRPIYICSACCPLGFFFFLSGNLSFCGKPALKTSSSCCA